MPKRGIEVLQNSEALALQAASSPDEAEDGEDTPEMCVSLEPVEFSSQSSFTEPKNAIVFNVLKKTLMVNGVDQANSGFFLATVHLKPLFDRLGLKITAPNAKLTVSSIKTARQLSAASLSTASIDSVPDQDAVLAPETQTAKSTKEAVCKGIDLALRCSVEKWSYVGADKEIVCSLVGRRKDKPSILVFTLFPAEDPARKQTLSINEADILARIFKLANAREGEDFDSVLRAAASVKDDLSSELHPWRLDVIGKGPFTVGLSVKSEMEENPFVQVLKFCVGN
jgi:hypothetical protein